MKKKAFTLAEIIIVLGIIGIIAELTIPSLVQNVSDQVSKTAWEKTFSVLNQAQVMITSESGGSLAGLCADNDNACLRDLFATKMRYVQKCETADIIGKCWPTNWTRMNGNATWPINNFGNEAGLILADGTFLVFSGNNRNCNDISNTLLQCAEVEVDINGLKAPNKIGKDIFIAHMLEDTLKPFGTPGDDVYSRYNEYACILPGDGEICSYDYLYK